MYTIILYTVSLLPYCCVYFVFHVDIRVLPFLDLDNDRNIFTGVDDSSIQFTFPEPFHFNQHTFTSGHVCYEKLVLAMYCVLLAM